MQDSGDASNTNAKSNVVKVDFEKSALNLEQKLLSEKKRQLFEKWLLSGIVTVLLDARGADVKVPPAFKQEGDLRLNFSYGFRIADFNFDDKAVWATLSFDGGGFLCHVPWTSVYGLQSAALNQGAVWFMDFPSDYDQTEVLGLSESESVDAHDLIDDTTEDVSGDNIIKYDFTGKKDLVK
jgi:hypothetical protein